LLAPNGGASNDCHGFQSVEEQSPTCASPEGVADPEF
jgi:hypothetical protein